MIPIGQVVSETALFPYALFPTFSDCRLAIPNIGTNVAGFYLVRTMYYINQFL